MNFITLNYSSIKPLNFFARNLVLVFMIQLLTLQSSFAANQDCQHDSHTFRCVQILKNYDGDTITVNIPNVHPLLGEKISVRVFGIDTPEIKTKNDCEKQAGRNARNLVENLLKKAKRVDLTNIQRDKYFRVLADVMVDGQSLKDLLIKNRLAYNYDGGTKKKIDWCEFSRMPSSLKK